MTDSPSAPVGAAVSEAAHQHAQAWMHAYGILTERYTAGGGDHPMMDTLPAAFEAYAATARSPSPVEVELRAIIRALDLQRIERSERCPICRAYEDQDHEDGCALAAALRDPDASGAPVNASTPPVNAPTSPKPPNVDTSAGHVDGRDRSGEIAAAYVHAVGWEEISGERLFRAILVFPHGPPPFSPSVVWNRTPVEIRALAPSDTSTSTGGRHGE